MTPGASETGRRVAAVILAAGESTRLGAFKPLLPWPEAENPQTLVEYQVRQLRAAGVTAVIVVVGERAAEVAAAATAAGGTAVVNARYREGKATSVRTGVAATPRDCALLLVGVDQPRPATLYRRFLRAAPVDAELAIPTYRGRRGHPLLIAPSLRDEVLAVEEATSGLRAVVQRHGPGTALVELDEPCVLTNLNTPEDVEAARAMHRGAREGEGSVPSTAPPPGRA